MRLIQTFDNALSPKLCQDLISSFEQDERVAQDQQLDYTTRQYLFLSDKPEWQNLCMSLSQIANDIVYQYFDRPDHMAETRPADWMDDGFVMACYKPGDTIALHTDGQCPNPPQNGLRLATLLFFLNDVAVGGELNFPLQKEAFAPKAGRAVIFPPDHMHPHEVLAPETDRYIVQTWITDPILQINEAY